MMFFMWIFVIHFDGDVRASSISGVVSFYSKKLLYYSLIISFQFLFSSLFLETPLDRYLILKIGFLIFLISSILMFISLILAPVFERFSWHFHQAFNLIFHFYYYIIKIEVLFILIAPSYVILFCFVDSISCFVFLKIPVMKFPNALYLSLVLLRFLFSVFMCLSSWHFSQNEAWGREWKLHAAKPHSGGLEANCVFDWRDSAWSECRYLQPFSLRNSISPKKRRLLLERKAMTNLDNILKSRDITLSTKVHLIKAMVFPVTMYWCESCTIKKAECWRTDAFQL